MRPKIEELTSAEIQARMGAGDLSARTLTETYLERIGRLDEAGPALKAIIELNLDALDIADRLDAEREASGPRGPLASRSVPVPVRWWL